MLCGARGASLFIAKIGLVGLLALKLSTACARDSTLQPMSLQAEQPEAPADETAPADGANSNGAFTLKPEWSGPCERRDVVDVNLGHAPAMFVRAAHCQITGREPSATVANSWAERLLTARHVRRIDVVRALCQQHRRQCSLSYSDPWRAQPERLGAPQQTTSRQVGAVFMFFFDCPGGVNCDMNWANTHALGMDRRHALYASSPGGAGFHTPAEEGFWRRELLEAEYAGLSFLLLNVYGPDLGQGKLAPLWRVLRSLKPSLRLALFDDTWAWGQPWFGDFWKKVPDLNDADAAANILYEAKWKPFFEALNRAHWYRFKGRPLIYFYNAGTLTPRNRAARVLEQMKARFAADFGEQPFLVVDSAFFEDPNMPHVADGRFVWYTFNLPEQRSRSTLHGHVLDNAMVKWDAIGRERPSQLATEADRIIKGSGVLERVLADSRDAELLVLATWNDLGEGTGIHRNYDYYEKGRWLEPDHFTRLIRTAQTR